MAEATDFWKNKETTDYFNEIGTEFDKYFDNLDESCVLKKLSGTDKFRGEEADAVKNFADCEELLLYHVRYIAHSANSMMNDIEDAFIEDLDETEDANYNRESIKELRDWFKKEGKAYKSHSATVKLIQETLSAAFSEFGTFTDPKFDDTIDSFDEICGYPEREESCFLKQIDSRFENFVDHAERIHKDYDIEKLVLSTKLSLRKAMDVIGNGKNITPDVDTSAFGVDDMIFQECYKQIEDKSDKNDWENKLYIFADGFLNKFSESVSQLSTVVEKAIDSTVSNLETVNNNIKKSTE